MIVSNEAEIIARLEPKPDTIYIVEADLPEDAMRSFAAAIKQATNGKIFFLLFHPGIIRSLNEMDSEQLERVRDSIVLVCNTAIQDVRQFKRKSPEECLKEDSERERTSDAA